MWTCDPTFAPLLGRFTERALRKHPGTVFGVWPNLVLACANPAWYRFARENGGEPSISDAWSLGASIETALGPLRTFYASAFEECLLTRSEWDHIYECSSSQLQRKFQMKAYPLGNSEGILVVNSLVVEFPHSSHADSRHTRLEAYRDHQGLLHMCAHCRRFRREDSSGNWDWISAYVASLPENVSHGLCPICYEYHFPRRDTRLEA